MQHSLKSGRLLRERGFELRTPPFAIAALDPSGSGDDFHAVSVVYREEWQLGEPVDPDFAVEKMFRIQLARRLPQTLEFTDVLASMLRLATYLSNEHQLGRLSGWMFGVETNGVGHGYAEALRAKLGTQRVLRIFTTAGVDQQPVVENKTTMPRMAGLDEVRMLMETQYLRAAATAEGMKDLEQELLTFVWRSKNRPEAMAGQHDDLVMALALAIWIGNRLIPPLLRAAPPRRALRVVR
jgi:hypothetical protein